MFDIASIDRIVRKISTVVCRQERSRYNESTLASRSVTVLVTQWEKANSGMKNSIHDLVTESPHLAESSKHSPGVHLTNYLASHKLMLQGS